MMQVGIVLVKDRARNMYLSQADHSGRLGRRKAGADPLVRLLDGTMVGDVLKFDCAAFVPPHEHATKNQ
jgi:hypothetical protein